MVWCKRWRLRHRTVEWGGTFTERIYEMEKWVPSKVCVACEFFSSYSKCLLDELGTLKDKGLELPHESKKRVLVEKLIDHL